VPPLLPSNTGWSITLWRAAFTASSVPTRWSVFPGTRPSGVYKFNGKGVSDNSIAPQSPQERVTSIIGVPTVSVKTLTWDAASGEGSPGVLYSALNVPPIHMRDDAMRAESSSITRGSMIMRVDGMG
jgi:hypothetical protein